MKTTARESLLSLLCLASVALAPVSVLQPAQADEYYYCGPNQYGGDVWFSDPENWTPNGGPPGSADVAIFDQDDYFDLYLAQPVITNKLLKVSAGSVEFFMAVQTTEPCDEPVTYELLGSGTFLRTAAIIGVTPGVEAVLDLSGGWDSHCAPPGTVNADGMLIIGQTVGSHGRLEFGRSNTGPVTWNSDYPALIGSVGTGELDIRETAELINSSATLGVAAGSVGTADIKGTWTSNGLLQVGDAGDAEIHVLGTIANNGDCYMASEPGSTANVYLMPSSYYSAEWHTQGNLYVGGTDAGEGGGAILTIYEGQFQVGQDTTVWDPGSITVYGGSAQLNDVHIRTGGRFRVMGGALNSSVLEICPGAEFEATDGTATCTTLNCEGTLDIRGGSVSSNTAYLAAGSGTTAQVTLSSNEAEWNCSGVLYAGGDASGPQGTGTLNVDTGAVLNVAGTMKVWDDFDVTINDGRINTDDLDITGDVSVLGSGILDLSGGPLDILNGGSLNGAIVGDDSTPVALYDAGSSWTMPGSLAIGAGDYGSGSIHALSLQPGATVTVEEEVTVHNVLALTLGGGTINADLVNLQHANFNDFGTINGKFLTTGSVTATGDLELGDINSPSGVQIGGMLEVGPHQVTLNKQGLMFVYGSTSIAGGTLVAPDGFGITSSLQVSGRGVIDTPNDPAKYLLNDGSIVGDSDNERIELAGYVKGFGTLDNVTITGVDAPGYTGPTAVSRGSVDYAGQLVIQIGGLAAGTEHDQVNHSGTAGLGGELTVELINGFEPSLGNSFTIVTYADHTGQFETLTLPDLVDGLQWQVNYGPSSFALLVVPGPTPGDMNCNGTIDGFDIDPFVLVLSSSDPYDEYYALYPDCDHMHADCNGDGTVNGFDIDPFVDLIGGA